MDTNVLLRFVILDDKVQHAAAVRLINGRRDKGESIFISLPVLCEFAWNLTSTYKFSRAESFEALTVLLEEDGFEVERRAEARKAVAAGKTSAAGYVDLLIGEIARAEGCRVTYTFDQKLLRQPGFAAPPTSG